MSIRRLFQGAWPRLLSRYWGSRIKDVDGNPKDTGVNPAMEELAAILSSEQPIELNAPITLINNTNGPAINIINQGSTDQTQGIKISNDAGQATQLGIGLGTQNVMANAYIPLASAEIDPLKAWLFYGQNNAIQYQNLASLGKDAPPAGPGTAPDQIDPGFGYQKGQDYQPGVLYGGNGGVSIDNRSLEFNVHPIFVVNKFFQSWSRVNTTTFKFTWNSNTYYISTSPHVSTIGSGLSDTLTVVSDVTCDGDGLHVTQEEWTFENGILIDVS